MSLNWKNDPDLSSKSDMDYLQDLIESLTSMLHSNPEDTTLLFKRGNAYLDKGVYQEAISDYSSILAVTPEDPISDALLIQKMPFEILMMPFASIRFIEMPTTTVGWLYQTSKTTLMP